jgi:spore germination protein
MTIHIVQPGETLDLIASRYNTTESRLIQDNDIINPNELVVGQSIVIAKPYLIHIVADGDTLTSIATAYGVSTLQLLRNNPYLADRDYLIRGETIIISYENTKGAISTYGYAYEFIDRRILKKTLPYLTYISVFGYRTIEEAEIVRIDDIEIIELAKDYGVAPIMLLSTLTEQGMGSFEIATQILSNDELVDRHITNILLILQEKGYYGLNITFQFISNETLNIYNNYVNKLADRLHESGFVLFVTITPKLYLAVNELSFEKIDYTVLGQRADYVMLLAFGWGYSIGPPSATSSIFLGKSFYDYVINYIPPEKIIRGITVFGYDWQLPFTVGTTRGNALSYEAVIALAVEEDVVIQYDQSSAAPYFLYNVNNLNNIANHIVWFKDSRSFNYTLSIISDYGFQGLGAWTVMQFFAQLWVVINSQYEIIKILDQDEN